jgi:hypothetical protein
MKEALEAKGPTVDTWVDADLNDNDIDTPNINEEQRHILKSFETVQHDQAAC